MLPRGSWMEKEALLYVRRRTERHEFEDDGPSVLHWETDDLGRPTAATLEALEALGCPNNLADKKAAAADKKGDVCWSCVHWVDLVPVVFSIARIIDDSLLVADGFGRGLPDDATIDALSDLGMNFVKTWEDKHGHMWELRDRAETDGNGRKWVHLGPRPGSS